MENSNITLNLETYLELINAYRELNQIKNLIEDNTTYEKDNLSFKNAWTFQEDLLKLIKYIDRKFYSELEQQGKA